MITYVDWFNHRRLHGEITERPATPPGRVEADDYARLVATTTAATQSTKPLRTPGGPRPPRCRRPDVLQSRQQQLRKPRAIHDCHVSVHPPPARKTRTCPQTPVPYHVPGTTPRVAATIKPRQCPARRCSKTLSITRITTSDLQPFESLLRPSPTLPRTGQHRHNGHTDLDPSAARLFGSASTSSRSAMIYIVQRDDLFYVVAYDGIDPVTGRERRGLHPVGDDRLPRRGMRHSPQPRPVRTAAGEGRADHVGASVTDMWLPQKRRQEAATA